MAELFYTDAITEGDKPDELRMFEHGFVRLDASMADDLSVVNSARVSFAVRRERMEDKDAGLMRFLMRDRHGSPFEHNSFRFHIRTPIFVAREWFRHRVGCLTGDTVVTFVNVNGQANKKLNKTLDELWEMWSQGEHPGLRHMRLRVLNEQTLEFDVGRLAEVFDSGVKPVYEVTLADGKSVSMTAEHRVFTSDGWRVLRDAVGLDGEGANARATRTCSIMVNGRLAHARRGAGPESSRRSLRGMPQRQQLELRAHPVEVVSVEFAGMQQTYDLAVEGPWHNFVANGMVVHNSFNEESGRYHKLGSDFYVPSRAAVRSQVGKPGSYSFEPVDEALADETIARFERIYKDLYAEYEDMLARGVAKELARTILPFGVFTQFYWTLNARSLMNFLSLRNASNAQYEIRVYAEAVERLFARKMPITHECFVEFGRRAP